MLINLKKNKKFSKYLFLDKNQLTFDDLLVLSKHRYKNKFNTITFNCNSISSTILQKLINQIEKEGERIADFMTGAPRYVNDYKLGIFFEDCN